MGFPDYILCACVPIHGLRDDNGSDMDYMPGADAYPGNMHVLMGVDSAYLEPPVQTKQLLGVSVWTIKLSFSQNY